MVYEDGDGEESQSDVFLLEDTDSDSEDGDSGSSNNNQAEAGGAAAAPAPIMPTTLAGRISLLDRLTSVEAVEIEEEEYLNAVSLGDAIWNSYGSYGVDSGDSSTDFQLQTALTESLISMHTPPKPTTVGENGNESDSSLSMRSKRTRDKEENRRAFQLSFDPITKRRKYEFLNSASANRVLSQTATDANGATCSKYIAMTQMPTSINFGEKHLTAKFKYCARCSGPADLACGSCYTLVYCCKNHQTEHWPNHEKSCNYFALRRSTQLTYQGPFVITRSETASYDASSFQLTALVDIPAKEKILDETPVLVAPWPRTKMRLCENFSDAIDLRIKSLTCFGCCSALTTKALSCPKCYLPVCSHQCARQPSHSSNECQLIVQRQKQLGKSERDPRTHVGIHSESDLEFLYEDVMIARLIRLFMEEEGKQFGNNDSWTKDLRSRKWYSLLSTWKIEEEKRIKESVRGEYVHGHMEQLLPLSLYLINDTAIIWKLFCVIEANAFKFQLPFKRFNVLCTLLPHMKHSCLPDAHAFLHEAEDSSLVVRVISGRNISKGEPIRISYVPLFYSFIERRLLLLDNYLFWCTCERCMDPYDCKLLGSSFKCNVCKEGGYLLPSTDMLEMGPGPKPSALKDTNVIQKARADYYASLNDVKFNWKCSKQPVIVNTFHNLKPLSKSRLVEHEKRTTSEIFDAYLDEEKKSAICLGNMNLLIAYLREKPGKIHEYHSILMKLNEDLLRGEMFDLKLNVSNSNLRQLQIIVESMKRFKCLLKTVNPAFAFQGYPVDNLQLITDEYERRINVAVDLNDSPLSSSTRSNFIRNMIMLRRRQN